MQHNEATRPKNNPKLKCEDYAVITVEQEVGLYASLLGATTLQAPISDSHLVNVNQSIA